MKNSTVLFSMLVATGSAYAKDQTPSSRVPLIECAIADYYYSFKNYDSGHTFAESTNANKAVISLSTFFYEDDRKEEFFTVDFFSDDKAVKNEAFKTRIRVETPKTLIWETKYSEEIGEQSLLVEKIYGNKLELNRIDVRTNGGGEYQRRAHMTRPTVTLDGVKERDEQIHVIFKDCEKLEAWQEFAETRPDVAITYDPWAKFAEKTRL